MTDLLPMLVRLILASLVIIGAITVGAAAAHFLRERRRF